MDPVPTAPKVGHRFRGFLPVVVDVETGGFVSQTDALLEIAAVLLGVDDKGDLVRRQTVFTHVEPFPGARLDPAATLAGAALGQTVLARALEVAGFEHDQAEAHSAIYDAERTADLFCLLVNRMRPLFADLTARMPPEPMAAAESSPEEGAAAAET